jgi:hypothetical protein
MDLGTAAFWIFVAAAVVASIWKKKHSEALRHETVRLLIEKGQKLDEEQLGKLLNPEPPDWMGLKQKPGKRGNAYRGLRIIGTILIFIAIGLFFVCVWRGMMLGIQERSLLEIATAIPILVMAGIGLFVSSRFVPRPPSDENKGN